jgi:hypothetical protein
VDDAQRERASKWFKEKWDYGPCPVCHDTNWALYPRLGQIPNLGPLGAPEERRIPALMVGCDTCGYIVAINALTAGVLVLLPEDTS